MRRSRKLCNGVSSSTIVVAMLIAAITQRVGWFYGLHFILVLDFSMGGNVFRSLEGCHLNAQKLEKCHSSAIQIFLVNCHGQISSRFQLKWFSPLTAANPRKKYCVWFCHCHDCLLFISIC